MVTTSDSDCVLPKDTSVVTTSDSDCVCQRTHQWSLRVILIVCVPKDTSVVTTSDSDCVCAKGHISGHYE